MTRRINTKFIAVLAICLVVLAVALGGAVYLSKKAVSAAVVQEADTAFANEDYKTATQLYAKAIRDDEYAYDVDLMLNAYKAHSLLPIDQIRTARVQIEYIMSWLDRAISVDPHDGRAFQHKMDLLTKMGHGLGLMGAWDRMYFDCDKTLENYPDMALAVKYRGVSQVHRMSRESINLSGQERQQIREDLQIALDANPEDAKVVKQLAKWHVLEAEVLDRLGHDSTKSAYHRTEARQISAGSVNSHGGDQDRLIDHINLLYRLDAKPREIRPFIDQLCAQLLTQPASSRPTEKAVGILLRLSHKPDQVGTKAFEPEDLQLAHDLVEAAIKLQPDHPQLLFLRGLLYKEQEQFDLAKQFFKQAWETPSNVGADEFIVRYSYVARGGLAYLSLAMYEIEKLTDSETREKRLVDIERHVANIKAEVGDIAAVSGLEGRISHARGEWMLATRKHEQLIDRTAATSISSLIRAAEAQENIGEWGAAADHLETVLEQRPNLTRVRQKLAEMYLNGLLIDKAKEHIDLLTEEDKDNQTNMRLRLEVLVRERSFADADELSNQIDWESNPKSALHLASVYHDVERDDLAISLFEAYFDNNLTDIKVLYWLVQLNKDKSKRLAYINQAREAGGDVENINRLATLVEDDLDPRQEMERRRREAATSLDNPVLKAAHNYHQLVNQENRIGAEAELAKLKDEPSYQVVVWRVFLDAIENRDWQTAEVMVTHARQVNDGEGADYAKCMFYLGRLNMARGRFERAIENFRAGLEMRKIYSDGWRYLGSALARAKDYDAAVEAFEVAVKQRPNNRAILGLAAAHNSRGTHVKALELLRTAYTREPGNEEVRDIYLQYELEHGDVERALALHQDIADKDPDNMANRRALARALVRKKRYREAKKVVRLVIEEDGFKLPNMLALTQLLADSGDNSGATQQLMKYIQNKGDQVEASDFVAVARQFLAMGNEDRAIEAYRRGIRIEDPKRRPVARELANILLEIDKGVDEAAKLYEQLWRSDESDVRLARSYTLALIRINELDKAESVVQHIVATQGSDVASLLLSAQIHVMQGNLEEAIENVDSAIEREPRRASLLLTRAKLIATEPNRAGEVLSLLDRAIKLNPMLRDAYLMKGQVYRERGELASAIRQYEDLLQRDPKAEKARQELAPLYRKAKQVDRLRSLLDESAKLFPLNGDWLWRQGLLARSELDFDRAIAKFRLAFKLNSSSTMLFDLVSTFLSAEKPKEALDILGKNADMVRKLTALQGLRGRALAMTHRAKEARAVFARAINMTKNLAQFLRVRNQVLEAIRYRATTELNYGKISDLVHQAYGDKWPIWVALGVADFESRQTDFDDALRRLERLEAQIGERPEDERQFFYRMYSNVLHKTERYGQASVAYSQLLEIDPNNVLAMNNLAYLLVEHLNEPNRAIGLAERANELHPDNPLILDTLGWALFKNQQYEVARGMLESSVAQKRLSSNCMHLAEVLLKLELRTEASDMLNTARSIAEQDNDLQAVDLIAQKLQVMGQ